MGGAREVVVEVRGLTTRLDGVTVHEALDLDVRRGEVLAIVGGSGTGKTTLLRAMVMLLRRMGIKDITVHGFRSTFRDYIGAETLHDYHTAEAALAHKLKDKVAAAYARTDLFDKRFRMMQDWEGYCINPKPNSNPIEE